MTSGHRAECNITHGFKGPCNCGGVPSDAAIASLRGESVRPIEGAHFSGVVAIPVGFRMEGESDNDVVLRYLDSLDESERSANG